MFFQYINIRQVPWEVPNRSEKYKYQLTRRQEVDLLSTGRFQF